MHCFDRCLNGTVVNWALPSLNRGLFEITFTVPSIEKIMENFVMPKIIPERHARFLKIQGSYF